MSFDIHICNAELTNSGVMDSVLIKYQTAAESWAGVMQDHATRLFMMLTAISMVWTFAQLMFHRSSLAELFGEMIRFMVFTRFFLWLLRNGPKMADAIILSMRKIGNQASNLPGLSPSNIVDMGFDLFDKACYALSEKGITSITLNDIGALIICASILVLLALVAVNMLLQLCAAWVLAYAGIFFLGFGGSRWTSDMAVNYFKTVLGLGASLMTMVLLVGIGKGVIAESISQMTAGVQNVQELGVLFVLSITLLMLVDKLPSMVSGIITGASIGSMGIGSFGAGAAVGAAVATSHGVGNAARTASAAVSQLSSAVKQARGQVLSGLSSPQNDLGRGRGDGERLSNAMGNRPSCAVEVGTDKPTPGRTC